MSATCREIGRASHYLSAEMASQATLYFNALTCLLLLTSRDLYT